MTAESPDEKSLAPSTASPGDERMLKDLREANEKLILAMIREQELTELAVSAQTTAELMTEKLRESERELRATAEFRERLLGIVGHDLRNPLGAISMCAQLMISEGTYDRESVMMLVSFLLTSVHRMDRMIKQLFQFTRARLGGGVPLELEATDLRPICQHTIEELTLTSTIPIKSTFAGNTAGTWDGERLIEALSNLVSNAIDHAASGTKVLVHAAGLGDEVVVTVSNQGNPIPNDLLPVLFEAFHRGRTGIKARAGHLGLGLFIAHEIARSHGGSLSAQSSEGTTTLTMRLPRRSIPTPET